jgi:hypothetical protein
VAIDKTCSIEDSGDQSEQLSKAFEAIGCSPVLVKDGNLTDLQRKVDGVAQKYLGPVRPVVFVTISIKNTLVLL